MDEDICILKFGSSVLRGEADIARTVTEIYRHYRGGRPVIAVVSAFENRTDRLIREAREIGLEEGSEAFIRMVSTGEYESAIKLSDALSEIGIQAEMLTPREISLTALGAPMHSVPVAVDTHRIMTALNRARVLIIPGYSAVDQQGETVLLGRGGSDMTAIFLASALKVDTVRLIKDVDGLYETDPNRDRHAKRYTKIDWKHAAEIGGILVQAEAVSFAAECGVSIDAARVGQVGGTTIGPVAGSAVSAPRRRPLRVALAGCGTVGGGVLERLMAEPERYEVTKVLVRDASKYKGGAPVVTTARRLLSPRPDVLIEAINGPDAARLHIDALSAGIAVISANKQAIAENHSALTHVAQTQKTNLEYSASVGGAAPILETIDALRSTERIAWIEAVLTGTVNHICSSLLHGMSFPDALNAAREAGFSEEDPRDDLSGSDAVAKAKLIAHHAFSDRPGPEVGSVEGLCGGPQAERLTEEGRLKQITTIAPSKAGKVEITVAMVGGNCPPELMALKGAACGALITLENGDKHFVSGQGAGRVPTTESILGDLGVIERTLIRRGRLDRHDDVRKKKPCALNGAAR